MYTMVLVLHYAVCILLIGSILLQSGKGANIGAVFGGSSQTLFGSRGPATFLNKLTAVGVVLFLFTSITLAQLSKESMGGSVIDSVTLPAGTAAPEQNGVVNPDTTVPGLDVNQKQK